MRNIVVFLHLTLDGIMQSPGRPDEDSRGGFPHGGWATTRMRPDQDPVLGQAIGESMAKSGPILFGRRTYQDFFRIWPNRTDNPFTEVLNRAQKYVASTTLKEPLPWQNSTLLRGNLAEAVTRLKNQVDKDIVVLGSGELVRSLIKADLVDEYFLLIHPLALGAGRRLFPEDGPPVSLQLADVKASATGVMIARYRPAHRKPN